MIGWFLVLSFVLGFGLTWLYMVRSVSRTVDPVGVRATGRSGQRPPVRQRRVRASHPSPDTEEIEVTSAPEPDDRGSRAPVRRRPPVVPQVVEFEDETETFYDRER